MSTDSLYVNNLNYSTDENSLRNAFPDCIRAQIVFDRNSNRSKGFGFVQFESEAIAQANLDKVGGPGGTVHIDGREVKVNYAHTKDQKERGGGSGGFRGGRGGGFRGGRGGGGYRGGRGGGSSGYDNWSQGGGGYGGSSGFGGYNQGGYGNYSEGYGQQGGQNWYGGQQPQQQQGYGFGDYSQGGYSSQPQGGWGSGY